MITFRSFATKNVALLFNQRKKINHIYSYGDLTSCRTCGSHGNDDYEYSKLSLIRSNLWGGGGSHPG
jgi:hypothetical protein